MTNTLLMEIWPFILIGFVAQLADGALGMGFGIISNTLLLMLGIPPAAASAGVHLAENFTTGFSGASHIWYRNVDWRLFVRLVTPAVIAGALGAYVLTRVDASIARPVVIAYLTCIGFYLIYRGITHSPKVRKPTVIGPLAALGGFLDAAGGGGWGPIVTGNLLIQGADPRRVIGTVNCVEFFLTFTISATFIFTQGAEAFTTYTGGLLIGGVLAAPWGGYLTKRLAPKPLLISVGVALVLTSVIGAGYYH
jgi:uncharacterized membrane protein YfcA